MTVHYQHLVATERVGGFFRLLFRWRGSIYRHIYGEIGVWLILYYIISICYRFAMTQAVKREFEKFCRYGRGFADYIPVTFVVGFYVVRVIVRRWTQWENIPWPERLAFDASTYILGEDMKTRMIRRTLMRYCNLGSILCFRDICVPAKKRFPQMDHLLVSGLLTPKELEVYNKTASKFDVNWWIPFHWAYTLLWRSHQEGKLGEGAMMRLHDGVNEMRNRCWVIFMHDWIPIPMVYTQVCTLSVYLYMLTCLFARQYITSSKQSTEDALDLYVPIFTIFQLVFYLGWMKVAEVLINPFGMDADDFDVNYIIDRNLRTSYTIVDYACQSMPPLEKDMHWNELEPELPHTEKSKEAASEPFIGSTANMSASETSESSNGGDSGGADDQMRLINRKNSQTSSIASSQQTGSRNRLNTMASKVKRLLSRQHTVNSTTTFDESKADALRDLLGAEEGDRTSDWRLPGSPNRSPMTIPVPKWGGRLREVVDGSASTLPRIEEDNENTLTKSAGKQLLAQRVQSDEPDRGRQRNLEQQQYFLDFLHDHSQPSVESVDGSRFVTTPVVQDESGTPVGSIFLPPGEDFGSTSAINDQRGPSPAAVQEHAHDGGGRFDMNTPI